MGGQMTRNALYDSLGGPFPAAAHRCHHKPKRCLPIQCGGMGGGGGGVGGAVGRLTVVSPLLFHPNAKGAQIVMDPAQRTVKRQASFCNAITFTNRPIALYEQVRLKITKKQCCWSGALRLGFTCKDPSRISPDSLPKYACPDLVSQSGFWAKALPEEFANEGSVLAFWVDKKGRVFYRVNESGPMLFFSGVRTSEPLWALIDVYGLTRGVQLLDSEPVPPDCLRPRSFTTARSSASLLLRGDTDDARLSVSLCDLNLQPDDGAVVGGNGGVSPALLLPRHQGHALRLAAGSSTSSSSSAASSSCPIPQNSLNSQQSSLLPPALESDLRFHRVRGAHVRALDDQTVARCPAPDPHGGERTLVFTDRPLRAGETVFVRVSRSGPASRPASLSYGVTACDPAGLRAADLPHSPEALAAAADRKEFWAVGRSSAPLQSGDILGFVVGPDGEVVLSHNGVGVGGTAPVCVENKSSSRPLWMFYGLHGAVTQLRILGSSYPGEPRGPSSPGSPPSSSSSPQSPSSSSSSSSSSSGGLASGRSDPVLSGGLCSGARCSSAGGTTPGSPKSPSVPSGGGVGSGGGGGQAPWSSEECSICYENAVDTVIYACGHMCLCHACGARLKKMANACCPICRRQIKDIIKTYRST